MDLPERLLERCEHYDSLLESELAHSRKLQEDRRSARTYVPLDQMLAEIEVFKVALGRDYSSAIRDIFRPDDAACGEVHRALVGLETLAILTSNYDELIELAEGPPTRQRVNWKRADQALAELKAKKKVLFKVHGCATEPDTVVMTASEYVAAHGSSTYQAVLSFLLQAHSFLFLGFGMNDPQDLDAVLRGNATAFRDAASRHYALLKDPPGDTVERLRREYNVQVISYVDHAQVLPFLLDLKGAS